MRRLAIVAVLVVVATLGYRVYGGEEAGTGTLTLSQPAPTPGQKAEDFTARTVNGERFTLDDRGIYVVSFWSSLNRGSGIARPEFEDLAQRYGDDNVTFVAVYVNNAPEDEEVEPYAVIEDTTGELASAYNVKRVPRVFLIQNGTIEVVQDGYYEDNSTGLRRELEEILQAREEEK